MGHTDLRQQRGWCHHTEPMPGESQSRPTVPTGLPCHRSLTPLTPCPLVQSQASPATSEHTQAQSSCGRSCSPG